MSLKYEHIIAKMSLEEKALIMSGKNTWQTQDFPQYGIPMMMMSAFSYLRVRKTSDFYISNEYTIDKYFDSWALYYGDVQEKYCIGGEMDEKEVDEFFKKMNFIFCCYSFGEIV